VFSASFNRLRPRLQAAMMARGDRVTSVKVV